MLAAVIDEVFLAYSLSVCSGIEWILLNGHMVSQRAKPDADRIDKGSACIVMRTLDKVIDSCRELAGQMFYDR